MRYRKPRGAAFKFAFFPSAPFICVDFVSSQYSEKQWIFQLTDRLNADACRRLASREKYSMCSARDLDMRLINGANNYLSPLELA